MELQDNPLLQQENFMSGYQESIDELKNHPELISFEKLCHAVFQTEDGKKLMEHIVEHYLLKPCPQAKNQTYQEACVFGEGFRYGYLLLRQNVLSHQQRIKAGAKV